MQIQVWITGLTVEQKKKYLSRCFADRQNTILNPGVSWPQREGRLNPPLVEVKESLFHSFSSTHAPFLVLETLITSLENPAFLMAVEIT